LANAPGNGLADRIAILGSTVEARQFAFAIAMVAARAELPDDTVMDDEVVALDEHGKPSFDLLQGLGNRVPAIVLYGFDLLMLRGRDVRLRSRDERRDELREAIKHVGSVSIEYSRYWSKSTSKAQLSPGSSLAPTEVSSSGEAIAARSL
jgi:ATP-dependent DNA ligase